MLAALACRSTTITADGQVVRIQDEGRTLVVRRDDVPGMSSGVTLRLAVADPALVRDATPDARVTIEYATHAFGTPTLVALRTPDRPAPLVHDHTPHHGGVVAMVGTRHLEARAQPDGRIEIYATDFHRRPLPLADAHGRVRIAGSDIALAGDGDVLVGHAGAIADARVEVHVEVDVGGDTLASDFVLPVAAGSGGAAAVAGARCVPADPAGIDRPRCTIRTSAPVSALAISPDGTTLLAAVAGAGVSVWRLPEGTLAGSLAPAPPIAVPVGESLHPEIVGTIAWRPDGAEALVVLEGRLLRYALPDGHLLGVLSQLGDVVRDAAWWPDGSRVLATAFHDSVAHVLDAESGREIARYDVKLEGTAVAVDGTGETVLVGSEGGTVRAFRAADGAMLRELAVANRSVVSIVPGDGTLVVLTTDGVVRRIDAETGGLRGRVPVGYTPARLATGPRGLVAAGLPSGEVTIVDPARAAVVRTLASQGTQVHAVAWHDPILVVGDDAGHIALWDVGK